MPNDVLHKVCNSCCNPIVLRKPPEPTFSVMMSVCWKCTQESVRSWFWLTSRTVAPAMFVSKHTAAHHMIMSGWRCAKTMSWGKMNAGMVGQWWQACLMPGCTSKVKNDLEHLIMPDGVVSQVEGFLVRDEDLDQNLGFFTQWAL